MFVGRTLVISTSDTWASPFSQAPTAVKAWKEELEAKKRVRLASTIADPEESPEAFDEGWDDALAKETEVNGA